MINVPAAARILLATRPADFRKDAHGLAALAEDPFSGTVIVYRSKRSDRVKILVWDTGGLVQKTHRRTDAVELAARPLTLKR